MRHFVSRRGGFTSAPERGSRETDRIAEPEAELVEARLQVVRADAVAR